MQPPDVSQPAVVHQRRSGCRTSQRAAAKAGRHTRTAGQRPPGPKTETPRAADVERLAAGRLDPLRLTGRFDRSLQTCLGIYAPTYKLISDIEIIILSFAQGAKLHRMVMN